MALVYKWDSSSWFFSCNMKVSAMSADKLHCYTIQIVYRVLICSRRNLLCICIYPINNAIPTLKTTKPSHHNNPALNPIKPVSGYPINGAYCAYCLWYVNLTCFREKASFPALFHRVFYVMASRTEDEARFLPGLRWVNRVLHFGSTGYIDASGISGRLLLHKQEYPVKDCCDAFVVFETLLLGFISFAFYKMIHT